MEKNRMKPTNGWDRQCETEYRSPRRLIQNNTSRNIPSALAITVWALLISQGNGRNGNAGAIRMRLTSEPPSKLEFPTVVTSDHEFTYLCACSASCTPNL